MSFELLPMIERVCFIYGVPATRTLVEIQPEQHIPLLGTRKHPAQ